MLNGGTYETNDSVRPRRPPADRRPPAGGTVGECAAAPSVVAQSAIVATIVPLPPTAMERLPLQVTS